MKAVVVNFDDSAILGTRAKASLLAPHLAVQLLKIKQQCECLIGLIEAVKSPKYSIKESFKSIKNFMLKKALVMLNVTSQNIAQK